MNNSLFLFVLFFAFLTGNSYQSRCNAQSNAANNPPTQMGAPTLRSAVRLSHRNACGFVGNQGVFQKRHFLSIEFCFSPIDIDVLKEPGSFEDLEFTEEQKSSVNALLDIIESKRRLIVREYLSRKGVLNDALKEECLDFEDEIVQKLNGILLPHQILLLRSISLRHILGVFGVEKAVRHPNFCEGGSVRAEDISRINACKQKLLKQFEIDSRKLATRFWRQWIDCLDANQKRIVESSLELSGTVVQTGVVDFLIYQTDLESSIKTDRRQAIGAISDPINWRLGLLGTSYRLNCFGKLIDESRQPGFDSDLVINMILSNDCAEWLGMSKDRLLDIRSQWQTERELIFAEFYASLKELGNSYTQPTEEAIRQRDDLASNANESNWEALIGLMTKLERENVTKLIYHSVICRLGLPRAAQISEIRVFLKLSDEQISRLWEVADGQADSAIQLGLQMESRFFSEMAKVVSGELKSVFADLDTVASSTFSPSPFMFLLDSNGEGFDISPEIAFERLLNKK